MTHSMTGGPVRTWLYVSEAQLAPDQANSMVGDIVHVSRLRNSSLGVTGALVFSGTRFAQLLEGGEEEIGQLRASIRLDRRHRSVTTVQEGWRSSRLFSDWSLVYSGPSRYVGRILEKVDLTGQLSPDGAAADLLKLFAEFSSSQLSRV